MNEEPDRVFNIAVSGGNTPALMFDLWANEYMDITLSTKEDGEVILTDRLNDYGKDGWEVYHIASGFGKTIVFMRRKTVKETRAK